MDSNLLTHDGFKAAFFGKIRVGFDRDRFVAERWPIRHTTLAATIDLARCFLPWYVGQAGGEVQFRDKDAIPVGVAQIPKLLSRLSRNHQAGIDEYVKVFASACETVTFSVPTYSIPGSRLVVMDGNHRLAALALAGVPFRVDSYEVVGPLDPRCLADLLVHKRKDPRVEGQDG